MAAMITPATANRIAAPQNGAELVHGLSDADRVDSTKEDDADEGQ